MSSLSEAMSKAGFDANETALMAAVSKYLNNGGTVARLRALVDDAAQRMTGDAATDAALQVSHGTIAAPGQPKGDGEGHGTRAQQGPSISRPPSPPDRGGKGHTLNSDKSAIGNSPTPREPSPAARAAALKVRQQHASTIWDRTIGGEVTLRGSTRHHWETMARKATMIGHVARRMLTEIDWPDDVTPLETVATEAQVKTIMNSGYDALEAAHVG